MSSCRTKRLFLFSLSTIFEKKKKKLIKRILIRVGEFYARARYNKIGYKRVDLIITPRICLLYMFIIIFYLKTSDYNILYTYNMSASVYYNTSVFMRVYFKRTNWSHPTSSDLNTLFCFFRLTTGFVLCAICTRRRRKKQKKNEIIEYFFKKKNLVNRFNNRNTQNTLTTEEKKTKCIYIYN